MGRLQLKLSYSAAIHYNPRTEEYRPHRSQADLRISNPSLSVASRYHSDIVRYTRSDFKDDTGDGWSFDWKTFVLGLELGPYFGTIANFLDAVEYRPYEFKQREETYAETVEAQTSVGGPFRGINSNFEGLQFGSNGNYAFFWNLNTSFLMTKIEDLIYRER